MVDIPQVGKILPLTEPRREVVLRQKQVDVAVSREYLRGYLGQIIASRAPVVFLADVIKPDVQTLLDGEAHIVDRVVQTAAGRLLGVEVVPVSAKIVSDDDVHCNAAEVQFGKLVGDKAGCCLFRGGCLVRGGGGSGLTGCLRAAGREYRTESQDDR